MRRETLGLVSLCILLLAARSGVSGEVKEEAGVAIVEVPVYVLDHHGNPVEDLKPEDFSVFEDGKKQELVFAQLMGTVVGSSPGGPVESRRHFVLFFDLTFNDPAGLKRARDASLEFVEKQLVEQDMAAVFTFSLTDGVEMLSNFTLDRRQLLDAISSIGITKAREFQADSAYLATPPVPMAAVMGIEPPAATRNRELFEDYAKTLQTALKKQDTLAYRSIVRDYLSEISDFARSLDVLIGRKYVIYFSAGFDAKVFGGQSLKDAAEDAERVVAGSFVGLDPSAREHDQALLELLSRAMSSFSSSDCRLYCIDPTGLDTGANPGADRPAPTDANASYRKQAALEMFASETGGKLFRNRNSLTEPLSVVVSETRRYYLLAYSAPPVKGKGAYHKIKVDVNRPGTSVSFRKGYYESKPFKDYSALDRNLQIADIVNRDRHPEDLSMNVQAIAFPGSPKDAQWRDFARVMVQTAVPGNQFQSAKGGVELEIYGFASTANGVIVDYFHGRFKMKDEDLRERLSATGINYSDLLLLPAGDYKLKIILRDDKNGVVGVKDLTLSVPNFTTPDLHMATPCFLSVKSDWVNVRGFDPTNPPSRLRGVGIEYPLTFMSRACAAAIYPNLAGGDHLMLIKLYNLQVDPQTQKPRADIGWQIIDADGRPRGAPQYKLAQGNKPDSGTFELLFNVRSPGLDHGLYWLRLQAFDRLAGKTATEMIPFFVD